MQEADQIVDGNLLGLGGFETEKESGLMDSSIYLFRLWRRVGLPSTRLSPNRF